MKGSGPVISTLGCRLNAFESEAMREMADAAGLHDAVIVNTCAVTSEAVRKSRKEIRRLARENPGARVVVTGCAAQIDPQLFADLDGVAAVIGNTEKMLAAAWARVAADDGERVIVDDIMGVSETASHLVDGFGRHRAYVQVQNGCDHRCTFCIIPYGRGNSRSVPAGVVVDQIKRLCDRGFNEVVLTGVDLTSWGAHLPGAPRLGNLVRRILKLVPELPRLRLSSIDSIEADPELLEAVATESRFMPHLHLSLQSGDDMILKRMKRRHLREDAIRFCQDVRSLRPDIAFGADIIAGFPTETEGMFENSLKLVDECDLTWLHVFPYSPRPGTPAARMPQVDGRTVRARAARLRAAGACAVKRHLDAQIGETRTVLTESPTMGRTGQFAEVRLSSPQPEGALIEAKVTGHDGRELAGDVVNCVQEAVRKPSGMGPSLGSVGWSGARIAFAESAP
ncbi:MAG: tRNA (N(6)-L-threonylcarbamoyladenosine(37)-C(2))-methylthiotransferase MtaB [Boseongicola sp. SB0675_bin_26]|nr:tRNA (N(6)-L-threonylcarbamoyladenosine(37)-C(2))-methylthiotransferase MtaB [Boseongicola sp. SB0675_bin_26]